MSIKKIHDQQPETFEFTKPNLDAAEIILKKYPSDRKKKCCDGFFILSSKTKSKLDSFSSDEVHS